VVLTNENIAGHLARIREDRQTYAAANAEEIRWTAGIYEKVHP